METLLRPSLEILSLLHSRLRELRNKILPNRVAECSIKRERAECYITVLHGVFASFAFGEIRSNTSRM